MDEINSQLKELYPLANMVDVRIFNRDTHTIVSCMFTVIHPQYAQLYHINTYYVSLDGTQVEIIGTSDHMREFPEQFNYHERFFTWIHDITEQLTKQRGAYILSNKIKKELIAAVWHPRRVARLLEEGGWDAVEAM